jgi:23S rRNA (adenine2030-N6)-methyltransferase
LRSQVQPFLRGLQRFPVKRVLRAELLVHADDSPLRLNGSGMVILNAPWNLDDTLREPLRALARLLGQGQPAEWKLDWLRQEGAEPETPSPLPPSRLAAVRALPARPSRETPARPTATRPTTKPRTPRPR